jgi:hypothetical protein
VRRRLRLYIPCVFVLLSCSNRPTKPAEERTSANSVQPPLVKVLRSGPLLDAAFVSAYGSPAPVEKSPDSSSPDLIFVYSPGGLIETADRFFLVTEAEGKKDVADFHAASGGLAFHIFQKSGDNLGNLVKAVPFQQSGYGFGRAPEWKLRTDLFSSPALVVESGFAQMGCVISRVGLLELTGSDVVPRADVLIHHEYPTQGKSDGVIEDVVRDRSFSVRYTGTFDATAHYTRQGNEYKSDIPDSSLPSC